MTRITRLLALTGALVCGGLGLAACGSSGPVPSNSVAVVGSMPITKATLAHWMAIAAHSTTPKGATTPAPLPDPPEYTRCIEYLRTTEHTSAPLARSSTAQLKSRCAASYAADKKAALEFLIPAEWAEGEAKELGVNVSDKEVEKEFEKIKKAGYKGGFENYLARTGYTVPDLLLKTKVERVLPPKLEKAVIGRAERAITKAIIAKYYKAHEATYHREEGRTLNILLTPTAAQANAAKAELEAGKSFKELGHVSILHTSKGGGVYLTTERRRNETGLEGPLFAAKTGVLTGPVRTSAGYYVFKVTGKSPARQESLAEVEERIRSSLVLKKIESELESYATLTRSKWKAKTVCSPGYVLSMYCKAA